VIARERLPAEVDALWLGLVPGALAALLYLDAGCQDEARVARTLQR